MRIPLHCYGTGSVASLRLWVTRTSSTGHSARRHGPTGPGHLRGADAESMSSSSGMFSIHRSLAAARSLKRRGHTSQSREAQGVDCKVQGICCSTCHRFFNIFLVLSSASSSGSLTKPTEALQSCHARGTEALFGRRIGVCVCIGERLQECVLKDFCPDGCMMQLLAPQSAGSRLGPLICRCSCDAHSPGLMGHTFSDINWWRAAFRRPDLCTACLGLWGFVSCGGHSCSRHCSGDTSCAECCRSCVFLAILSLQPCLQPCFRSTLPHPWTH